MTILTILSTVLGLFVTLGVIFCTTVPNIRNKIKESFIEDQRVEKIEDTMGKIEDKVDELSEMMKEQQKENALSAEADVCLIRDRITRIYYKNQKNETLKSYELADLNDLYKIYKKFDGNHYVDTIYDIMIKWEIVQ